MVLYHVYGVLDTQMMKIDPIESDDFSELVRCFMAGYEESPNEIENKELYKRNKAHYFIAGEMKALKRSNENVLNRTLLTLDIDDLPIRDDVFIECLKKHNRRMLAYPTLSHTRQDDTCRYRLIFDLDRPVNKEEYARLVTGVTNTIAVKWCGINNYKPDSSNVTFSQLQGFYVKTTNNKDAPYFLNRDAPPIEVDKLLDQTTPPPIKLKYNNSNGGKPNKILLYLIDALNGVELSEGGRNNYISALVYTGLIHSHGNIETIERFIEAVETYNQKKVNPPLTDSELLTIIRSALKSFERKGK